MPENVHRRAFAGKAAAKLLENIVDANHNLMKSFDIFLVVGFVFGIVGKRYFRWSFVRNGFDFNFDSKLGKISEQGSIEIGDGQSVVQSKLLSASITRADLQFMIDHVDLDLE